MEIQQPSSVGQATALFTGLTQRQVQDTIKRIYPYRALNTLLHSKNAQEAISSTGSYTDFKERDYIEAHRLLQGVITNPWQSIHDIEAGKADPFYYDSGVSDIQDIQQKTMGTVTGASDVRDPRAGFIDNLMKMKMFQKKIDNDHSYNYLTNLFLTQVDNGSTYYQTQALRQNAELGQRTSRQLASRPALDHHTIIKNTNMGTMSAAHSQRKRNVVYNPTPHFTHNIKRAKLDDLHHRFTKHIDEGGHKHPHSTTTTPLAPPLSSHPGDIMGYSGISPSETPRKPRRAWGSDYSPVRQMTPFGPTGEYDPTDIPTSTPEDTSPNRTANERELKELEDMLNIPDISYQAQKRIMQKIEELTPAQKSIVTLTDAGETIHSVADEETAPPPSMDMNQEVVENAIKEFTFPDDVPEMPEEQEQKQDSTQFQTPEPSRLTYAPMTLSRERHDKLMERQRRDKHLKIKYIRDRGKAEEIYNRVLVEDVLSDPHLEDFTDFVNPSLVPRGTMTPGIFDVFQSYYAAEASGKLPPEKKKQYIQLFQRQERHKDHIEAKLVQENIHPNLISDLLNREISPHHQPHRATSIFA